MTISASLDSEYVTGTVDAAIKISSDKRKQGTESIEVRVGEFFNIMVRLSLLMQQSELLTGHEIEVLIARQVLQYLDCISDHPISYAVLAEIVKTIYLTPHPQMGQGSIERINRIIEELEITGSRRKMSSILNLSRKWSSDNFTNDNVMIKEWATTVANNSRC